MTRSPRLSPRDAAMRVLRKLRDAGHVAYFAGGCVRDQLIGHVPKDYDIASDATPDHVRKLFPRCRRVGEAFGVMLVRSGGLDVEVAAFRTEADYRDGRRPAHVAPATAEQDAQRRDFTINGLFEDPLADSPDARILDYVGGLADLRAGVVRAIGDPDERFAEDHLRMLRAVRFAARLGFNLDPATADAAARRAPRLARISRERIGDEVRRMLLGPHPAQAVTFMQQLRLDAEVLGGHMPREPRHLAAAATPIESLPAALAAWAMDRRLPDDARLDDWADAERAELVRRWRRQLNLSNHERDGLRDLLRLLVMIAAWTDHPLAARRRAMATTAWTDAQPLLPALWTLHPLDHVRQQLEEDLVRFGDEPAPPRWVNGDDLVQAGVHPGPAMGQLLERVYDAQLEGRLPDRPTALAWAVQQARQSD